MFEIVRNFIRGINYKYIKPWFFSSDDPDRIKAPYVISFVFLLLTVFAIIIHIIIKIWQFHEITGLWKSEGADALPKIETISKIDMSLIPLISILIGTAGMFIGLYNWGKKGGGVAESLITGDGAGESSSPGDGKIRESEI